MTIELIGVLTVLLGFLCLRFGPDFSSYALFCTLLLGAAAAALIGGANLPPAHLLLGFLAVDLLLRPRLLRASLQSLAPFGAGFWFLLTLCYGVPGAFILPRLFAGATYVFAIGQSDSGVSTILLTPLAPVSGNITQTIYLVGGFVTFVVFSGYASRGLEVIARAVLVAAFVNVGFAVLDVVTYLTNTAELLGFIRNASYRMLADVEISGFKRIVGSFPEASAFAYYSVGLFAFSLSLWLNGVLERPAGVAAMATFFALIFATSTSGYVALFGFLAAQYGLCIYKTTLGRSTRNGAIFLALAPLVGVMAVLLVLSHTPTLQALQHLIDVSLLTKLESDSGLERASWNQQALAAFQDTLGFGAGIGSVRASSWLAAVLATMGIVGTTTFWLFIGSVFVAPKAQAPRDAAVQSSAKMACFAQLIVASVAGGSVDLGILFFALAGVTIGSARMESSGRARAHAAPVAAT